VPPIAAPASSGRKTSTKECIGCNVSTLDYQHTNIMGLALIWINPKAATAGAG
jgi:hypothetical protein